MYLDSACLRGHGAAWTRLLEDAIQVLRRSYVLGVIWLVVPVSTVVSQDCEAQESVFRVDSGEQG